MLNLPNYTSSPVIKQNYTSQAGLRLKNLSHLLGERYCQTPNAMSNRIEYNEGERFCTSSKPRSSASIEPYKRHHSYINHADVSSSTVNEKENSFLNFPLKRAKPYKGFAELAENPLDEEKTYYEGSRASSSLYRRDRSTDSQDTIQKQDSFYMRFSNIKLKTTTLPTFQELEEAGNEDKTLGPFKPVDPPKIDFKYGMHSRKATENLKRHVSKPSVPGIKKNILLPYQTTATQFAKGETYANLNKRHQANKVTAAGKENRPINAPQKTLLNIYQRGLKRCLTANQEATTAPPVVSNGANTTKASMNSPQITNLKGLLRGLSGREGNSRGNKTLFIGNKNPLKIEDKLPQFRATFIGSSNPEENIAPYCTKRERNEPAYNIHTQIPQERTSAAKIPFDHSPLKTLTDRSLSNPKLKVHKVEPTPTIIQPKPFISLPKDLKDLKFDKILGQGAYAVVKLAQNRHSGEQVAVKTYEKSKLRDPAKMRNVKREISLLKEMDHPHVIKLHTSFETLKQMHLVMEYVGNVSLQSYLKSKTARRLEEQEAKKLFRQLCQGISYCHSKNVMHRDIKLDNILLDEELNVKVIDFGFSICTPPEKTLTIFCGTPSYMSPEIVTKCQYKGGPSDVWALGVVLYALLCGRFPFRGMDEKELFGKIKKGKYDMPGGVSPKACELLQKILRVKPEERLTVHQILEEPWLCS